MPDFAPGETGKIFLIDLNEQVPRAQALKISGGFEEALFNPHGISTFIGKGKGCLSEGKGRRGEQKPLVPYDSAVVLKAEAAAFP